MQRRLAVIFVADMVDYSSLMEADQGQAIGLIRDLRERWLEPEAARRGGEVLKRMGDGWIIAFNAVTDAVETAQAVQTALANQDPIKLRIAAHLGEIAEDGTDVYGTGINIAARLQTEAPPGGVLISEDLHRLLDEKLAEDFRSVGDFELKNIAKSVRGFQWRPVTENAEPIDDIPVVAVEPIVAVPHRQDLEEAAADLQEQIALNLSRRTGIRVLSLEKEDDAKATYLVKGRLRAGATPARLILSLILRESGRVLWSDAYENHGDDIYELIDLAAGRADAELRHTINMLDGERFDHLPDSALSASELRARAANNFYTATAASYERAIGLLERALRLAPENPMGLAMWAYAWTWLLSARFEKGDRALRDEIVARADAAAQSDSRSDFIGKVRTEIMLKIVGDLEAAKRAWTHARKVNPNYANFKVLEIEIALAEGSWDRAGDLCTTFLSGYPKDDHAPYILYIRSVAMLLAGQLEEAARSAGDAVELRPSCQRYWRLLAEIHRRSGDAPAEERARASAGRIPDDFDLYAPALVLPKASASLMATLAPHSARPDL